MGATRTLSGTGLTGPPPIETSGASPGAKPGIEGDWQRFLPSSVQASLAHMHGIQLPVVVLIFLPCYYGFKIADQRSGADNAPDKGLGREADTRIRHCSRHYLGVKNGNPIGPPLCHQACPGRPGRYAVSSSCIPPVTDLRNTSQLVAVFLPRVGTRARGGIGSGPSDLDRQERV